MLGLALQEANADFVFTLIPTQPDPTAFLIKTSSGGLLTPVPSSSNSSDEGASFQLKIVADPCLNITEALNATEIEEEATWFAENIIKLARYYM